jgi:hypothetical protein
VAGVARWDWHGVKRTFLTLTDTDLFRVVYYAERQRTEERRLQRCLIGR